MVGSRLKLSEGDAVGQCKFISDSIVEKTKNGYRRKCVFECFCGKKFIALLNDIKSGHTKSCGCRPTGRITHGKTVGHIIPSEYAAWQNMLDRCYNSKKKQYKDYGGRGIKVCDNWLNSFEEFYSDMGAKPTPYHSLERIENNEGYSKDNCKWALRIEQANNTRRNIFIEYKGERRSIKQWSKTLGVHFTTIAYRFHKKLPVEKILHKGHLQKINQ